MEEFKVRHIVNEIARDINEIDDILNAIGVSREEYVRLSNSRAFRDTLNAAKAEWQSAPNTPKRARLRAAVITEELMLKLFFIARDGADSLGMKVKALEAISKIAGLGTPDPVMAGATGNSFNLQINFSSGQNLNLELGGTPGVIEGETSDEPSADAVSEVFLEDELEEL